MITLDRVVKEFKIRRLGTIRAVDEITFEIGAGEMVGYIGPNGAGKSTTVKILTGVLVASSGAVRVGGLDPSRERVALARHVGVVFGQRTQLWWDLPLGDSFELLRHMYRIPPDRFRANVGAFCDLLDLGPLLTTPVRQLSLGQRMRGDLAASLLHDPSVVYLDEPTIGLDVVAKARIRQFLTDLNRDRGVTVLLTTHDTGDIERLCRRVIVIDRGRLLYDGDLRELVRHYGAERTLVVDLAVEAPPLSVEGARFERAEGVRQWLRFPVDASAAELVSRVAASANLVDLSIEEPDIEGIIRRIYLERPDQA